MINYIRSATPPASLALLKRYDGNDVRERLWADGNGKCYLCEIAVDFGAFEVDHRQPKGENSAE